MPPPTAIDVPHRGQGWSRAAQAPRVRRGDPIEQERIAPPPAARARQHADFRRVTMSSPPEPRIAREHGCCERLTATELRRQAPARADRRIRGHQRMIAYEAPAHDLRRRNGPRIRKPAGRHARHAERRLGAEALRLPSAVSAATVRRRARPKYERAPKADPPEPAARRLPEAAMPSLPELRHARFEGIGRWPLATAPRRRAVRGDDEPNADRLVSNA